MNNHVAWLLLSFAIMVVAVLARLSAKLDELERRLAHLEAPEPRDGDPGWGAHGTVR